MPETAELGVRAAYTPPSPTPLVSLIVRFYHDPILGVTTWYMETTSLPHLGIALGMLLLMMNLKYVSRKCSYLVSAITIWDLP